MCGIAGYIPLKKNEVDASRLKEMTNVISHRGPDDEGFFIDELVGLGHRRLSIIDLSKDGHQPMSNDDGLIITYNGEVYNYIELREELEKEGEIFNSFSNIFLMSKWLYISPLKTITYLSWA